MKLELQTERLLLTPLALTDLDLALELWTDPEVVKYICDVMTEAEVRQDMSDSVKRGGNGGMVCMWAKGIDKLTFSAPESGYLVRRTNSNQCLSGRCRRHNGQHT